MQGVIFAKQKVIDAQERKIHTLDAANTRLLSALSQLKERYQGRNGIVSSSPSSPAKLAVIENGDARFKSSSCWLLILDSKDLKDWSFVSRAVQGDYLDFNAFRLKKFDFKSSSYCWSSNLNSSSLTEVSICDLEKDLAFPRCFSKGDFISWVWIDYFLFLKILCEWICMKFSKFDGVFD